MTQSRFYQHPPPADCCGAVNEVGRATSVPILKGVWKKTPLIKGRRHSETLTDGRVGIRTSLNCTVKAVDDAPQELDFIATDETVDRYNEVIRLDAWDLTHYRRNPVVVDSHDYSSVSRILGISTEVAVTGGKLMNRVRFATDNPLGLLAYKMAKGGFIKSESVGFIPLEWTRGDESKGEPYRTFTKAELLEISLVAVPANPGATLGLAVKSGAVTETDLREVADLLKRLATLAPAASRVRLTGFSKLLTDIRGLLNPPQFVTRKLRDVRNRR